jgi:hypothetical protein
MPIAIGSLRSSKSSTRMTLSVMTTQEQRMSQDPRHTIQSPCDKIKYWPPVGIEGDSLRYFYPFLKALLHPPNQHLELWGVILKCPDTDPSDIDASREGITPEIELATQHQLPDFDDEDNFPTMLILQKFLRHTKNDIRAAGLRLKEALDWWKQESQSDYLYRMDRHPEWFDGMGYITEVATPRGYRVATWNIYKNFPAVDMLVDKELREE